jgi:hypothetical protein
MTEHDAREDLQIIKSMLEKTRQATAESGTLFIFWGILISLALIASYILGSRGLYQWEWLNWIAMTVIGWVVTVVYSIRRGRREKLTTYVQLTVRHVYFSCGVGFLLVGLVFPVIGVYSYEAIIVLISAVTGILFFTLAAVFDWPLFRGLGLLWWLGAIGMSFVREGPRTLIYTGLFVVGFLVPAFLIRAKYRKDRSC